MIYFKQIRWKNFLSTGNIWTSVALNRSKTTLIVGENGSGKSTMLDALSFALYGIPFRDINKPQLVNTITNKHCLVEVDFSIGPSEYVIRRGIKPSIFEIQKDGVILPQPDRVDDYQTTLTNDILKLKHKSFKQVVILGSANYVPFMSLKDKERREVIEDLLDIQVFSVMNKLLSDKAALTIKEIHSLSDELSFAQSNLEIHNQYIISLLQDKTQLIQELTNKRNGIQDSISSSESQRLLREAEVAKLTDLIKDYPAASNRSKELVQIEHSLEDKLTHFKQHIQFFEQSAACPTCAQEINAEFKNITVDQYGKKISELTQALSEIDLKHNKVSIRLQEIADTNSEISKILLEISSINTTISHYLFQIIDIGKDITRLETKEDAQNNNKIEEIRQKIRDIAVRKKQLLSLKEIEDHSAVFLKDTGIKTRIIRQYIPIINIMINKYLAEMNFFINFEMDENFKETIKSSYRDDYTYNSFSEGEKLRISLSILFTWRAVAKMRNSMSTNLLILDEIFDSSLDSLGVEDFLTILDDVGGETNTFVISHKSQMFDKFHSAIKFEKIRNFSKIADKVD